MPRKIYPGLPHNIYEVQIFMYKVASAPKHLSKCKSHAVDAHFLQYHNASRLCLLISIDVPSRVRVLWCVSWNNLVSMQPKQQQSRKIALMSIDVECSIYMIADGGAFSSWNANCHRYNHLKGPHALHTTRQDERVNLLTSPCMTAVVLVVCVTNISCSEEVCAS